MNRNKNMVGYSHTWRHLLGVTAMSLTLLFSTNYLQAQNNGVAAAPNNQFGDSIEDAEILTEEERTLVLRDLIRDLTKEGAESFNKKSWLTMQSNAYQRYKIEGMIYSERKVVEALRKRLHREPSVDAYVKLQLLSLLSYGSMADISPKMIWSAIQARPAFPKRPAPAQKVLGDLGAVDTQVAASIEQMRRAEKAWKHYTSSEAYRNYQFRIAMINAYRKQLIETIPHTTFMKTYLRVVDMRERIENGQIQGIKKRGKNDKTGEWMLRDIKSLTVFKDLAGVQDYSGAAQKILEKQITALAMAQGTTFERPWRKHPGSEWHSGQYTLQINNKHIVTETYKVELMRHMDYLERKHEMAQDRKRRQ